MPITSITTSKNIVSNTDYVFKFGKHKGETVEDILNCDPGYILWMDDEGIVKFSDKIYQEAQSYDWDEDYDAFTFEHWKDE